MISVALAVVASVALLAARLPRDDLWLQLVALAAALLPIIMGVWDLAASSRRGRLAVAGVGWLVLWSIPASRQALLPTVWEPGVVLLALASLLLGDEQGLGRAPDVSPREARRKPAWVQFIAPTVVVAAVLSSPLLASLWPERIAALQEWRGALGSVMGAGMVAVAVVLMLFAHNLRLLVRERREDA